MRNVRWPLWVLKTCRTSAGLPFVLALLTAGFLVQEQCLAQPASVPAIAASTGATWNPTGSLNVARSAHTATLLQNGKVLVAGGSGDDSAELYDPVTGTWSVTGRLNIARYGHAATLLQDGRVLVVGGVFGRSQSILDVAELYDPGTGTWSRTSSPVTIWSFLHTATLLRSGKVLVAGGLDERGRIVPTAALYDPATDLWSSTGSLNVRRASHQAVRLQDGRVLAAGGSDAGDFSEELAGAEIYDPIAGRWSNTTPLLFARADHTATPLPNGRILVAGGSDIVAELFDPATSRWVITGRLNARRIYHTATLLPDGKVLTTGGVPPFAPSPFPLNSAEQYDPSNGKWEYTGNLSAARQGHTATLLTNGKVLVVGGNANGVLNSAELYESVAPISATFTGSWFNPAQNGHGFALEVLPGPPRQFLAAWFTFAPQGGQAWIVGVGPIDGNRAVLQGYQSAGIGARFPPNFDATNVHQEAWGTLTFTFSDCSHGHVDWVSSAPGYGSGGMDLTRLTFPAGLTCSP